MVAVFFAALVVGSVQLSGVAVAQTQPSETPVAIVDAPESSYKQQPIRRTNPERRAGLPNTTADDEAADDEQAAEVSPSTGFGTFRVLLSLGIVIAIIVLLKYFGQRFFNPAAVTGRGSSRAVEMLSRTVLGPKQQVMLIRVGKRRVIVVGDSGGQLTSLDQITDSDEIAELTTQIITEKSGPASTAFASLFSKSTEKFEDEVTDADERKALLVDDEMVDSNVASTQQDLAGLLAKVRKVSNKLGGA